MSLLPSARWQAGVDRGEWQDDAAQRAVMAELDRLHQALCAPAAREDGLLARLFSRQKPAPAPVRGLYLWGGVGRGKTFMVDLFYESLPFAEKHRAHFHRFMGEIHARLKQHAGERDPMAAVVRAWRQQMRVLVLDEFFVTDIGDAMLLGRLLQQLFAEGVVLVTTSNTVPANLYKDGLQRARFLPAIALLEQHCVVLEIASQTDYRLRELTRSPVYHVAQQAAGADAWMAARWAALAHVPAVPGELVIDGRAIACRARHNGFVWFDFAALCEGPRAAADYIHIASEFHTVFVGGIPQFDGSNDDPARRFVHAIDEFYDRHVNLVASAAASPVALYSGERLAHAFERTASRLVEMQSAEYLAREHLA